MGLVENLLCQFPKISLEIDLSKIRIKKIFKWLKKKKISDEEMMRTFNCGVGFCLIAPPQNLENKKSFSKKILSV